MAVPGYQITVRCISLDCLGLKLPERQAAHDKQPELALTLAARELLREWGSVVGSVRGQLESLGETGRDG